MRSMKRCHQCDGFIPALKFQCPNCDSFTAFHLAPGPLKTALTILAGSAVAMTLSACYGSPCASANGMDGCGPMPEQCQIDEVDNDDDGFCGDYDCDDNKMML